jgi:hypothetical protein
LLAVHADAGVFQELSCHECLCFQEKGSPSGRSCLGVHDLLIEDDIALRDISFKRFVEVSFLIDQLELQERRPYYQTGPSGRLIPEAE